MAVDETLLDGVAAGTSPPTLRFYGWAPPAVSLGRFQEPGEGLHLEVCCRRGWDVVRRPTGGRAVLHDQEITYSLALPEQSVARAGVVTSHCLFAGAFRHALARLHPSLALSPGLDSPQASRGNPACFAAATSADGLIAGRKLVGAAQVRRGGALLQHGSLLLRTDRDALAELFDDPGKPVALAELLPSLPPVDELQDRLADGLAVALRIHLVPGELTAREVSEARSRLACHAAPPRRTAAGRRGCPS
jgi:lipoyl(octanoyl) transferase